MNMNFTANDSFKRGKDIKGTFKPSVENKLKISWRKTAKRQTVH